MFDRKNKKSKLLQIQVNLLFDTKKNTKIKKV